MPSGHRWGGGAEGEVIPDGAGLWGTLAGPPALHSAPVQPALVCQAVNLGWAGEAGYGARDQGLNSDPTMSEAM